jgi:excisionase family DNA binding protein
VRGKVGKAPPTRFEREGLPTAVLDVREAAAYLAVSEGIVRALVRRGELPHVRVGAALEDLDRFLAENVSRKWQRDPRGRPKTPPAKKEPPAKPKRRANA